MVERQAVTHALSDVSDVGAEGNIVTHNRIRRVDIDGGVVKIALALPPAAQEERDRIEDACFDAVMKLDGVDDGMVATTITRAGPAPAAAAPQTGDPFEGQAPIPGVKHIIAVASGKGGVGKSTVCVNLALALKQNGARVGLMDADVYGPSLQVLLGVNERPTAGKEKEARPVDRDGLKMMSLGFLSDRDTPLIWRGPIVMGVIKKFLTDVEWGELDYLMIDLPPGTGDAQLTLAQTVPLTAAIIVTTPSELAIVDAQKGLRMFEQVKVPVMGIVENMSTFVCPHCGESTDIFDSGGAERISRDTKVRILGSIPLDPQVRAEGDRGKPIVEAAPDSPVARAFLDVAQQIASVYPARVS
jgi:ATP-binding protein involved in chromosome partitioning